MTENKRNNDMILRKARLVIDQKFENKRWYIFKTFKHAMMHSGA